jgi:nucleoside-diphosphate-sugar epimerase
MRIVIIGASGNVGTALLRRLQQERLLRAEPLELVGVSRRVPDSSKRPFGNVLWHSLDVGAEEDKALLRAALEGADAVVHLAWVLQPNHDLEQLYRTNVTGTANMLEAARDAGVGHIVCASSVGAYSSAGKETRIDESWPATGIPGSHYSRHKAEQEGLLDRFAAENPGTVVARLRPALTFQRDAGSEIGRYFLGPLIPKILLTSPRTPILPVPEQFVFRRVLARTGSPGRGRVQCCRRARCDTSGAGAPVPREALASHPY